jgi:hypothetical protein
MFFKELTYSLFLNCENRMKVPPFEILEIIFIHQLHNIEDKLDVKVLERLKTLINDKR